MHLKEDMIKKNSVQEKELDDEPADDSREPAEESEEEEDAMYSLTELQQEKLDLTDDLIGGKSGLKQIQHVQTNSYDFFI